MEETKRSEGPFARKRRALFACADMWKHWDLSDVGAVDGLMGAFARGLILDDSE